MSRIIRIFAAIILLLIVFVFICHWVMDSLPVSSATLSKITTGMPKEAVKSLLGPPDNVTVYENNEEWRYAKNYKWTIVTIDFVDNRVSSVEIDR